MDIHFYEDTSTFTFVITRIFARPPYCGLCRWLQKATVPSSPCNPSHMAVVFTMTGLSPVRKCYTSLGTLLFKMQSFLFSFYSPILQGNSILTKRQFYDNDKVRCRLMGTAVTVQYRVSRLQLIDYQGAKFETF